MATGDDIEAGKVNGAEDRTILHGQASEDGTTDFNGNAILIVEPDTGPILRVRHDCHGVLAKGAGTGAAVFGESEVGQGVLGTADAFGSFGVRGENDLGVGVSGKSRGGVGVEGQSQRATAIIGESNFGIGVRALGMATGVRGDVRSPTGVGVFGATTDGRGVSGFADTGAGVDGFSAKGVAVVGRAGGPAAPPFDATAPEAAGVAVYGRALDSRGGVFEAGKPGDLPIPQLRLLPLPKGPDLGLPRNGEPGDFFVKRQGGDSDQAELWFCIDNGLVVGQGALWGLVSFSQTRRAP